MHSRALRRALALATIPILALFTAVLGFSSVASAHDVSGISANCNEVTVQFVEAHPGEQAVVNFRTDESRDAGLYRQVLDFSELHFCRRSG